MILSILFTVGIVAGIGGFLALLLVIAESTLANNGECKITINGKKELKVKGGSSLLTILNNNKIYLSSACGGRGSCGFCKCKVIEGGGPLLPTETPFLDEEEKKNNVRLACQVKVKQDIKIEIPEDIFAVQEFTGKVTKISDLTYDIKEMSIELITPKKIDFKAGQYVQFVTPRYEKSRQPVTRAYSISSSPEKKSTIQLIIKKVPEGLCTTYIHEYLKEGDTVFFTGPFGDFVIRDTQNDMLFVAGGSGKAPIKSMLEFLNTHDSKRRMIYFFGARTEKDLYLTELFVKLEKELKNFVYVPILSRPEENSGWKGKTGYIMPYLKENIKDAAHTEAYLCGSPGMIDAVKKELHELKISDDNIFYDSFS
jgi:Na+-transporting NADH:ubiquinone oxidoreductase subunit F